MALKDYIGLARLTQVLGLLKSKIDAKAELAESMTTEEFEEAENLPDGLYPIEEEDLVPITADMVKYDSEHTVEDKIDELDADLTVLLTGTITAGNTSVTISNEKITTSSIIDIYFEDKVLAPTNVTVTTGQIVIEIDAQDSDTNVGVRCL